MILKLKKEDVAKWDIMEINFDLAEELKDFLYMREGEWYDHLRRKNYPKDKLFFFKDVYMSVQITKINKPKKYDQPRSLFTRTKQYLQKMFRHRCC